MLKIAFATMLLIPVLASAQPSGEATPQGQVTQRQTTQGQATQGQAARGPTQQGQASYFDAGPKGHTETASGAPVQPNANTAASRTLPLGSTAKVTNERNGKSTDVKITDRGPTRHDRVIDLSKKAAGDLNMQKTGTAPVKVQPEQH